MPEGDTLYQLAFRLRARLKGQTLLVCDARDESLRQHAPIGQILETIESRGKHLLMHFSAGLTLDSHLRMDGRWIFRADAVAPAVSDRLRVVLRFEGGVLLGYELAIARFIKLSSLPAEDLLRRLGPDLLADDFDPEDAVDHLMRSNAEPIGVAVMRQSVMAGVGNVFKSEALFLAGISPLLPVKALTRAQLISLVKLFESLLRRNAIGPRYGQFRRRTRTSATSGPLLWVYRRAGERCMRCDDIILMVRQGQPPRSTYYCPTCQLATGSEAAASRHR